MYASVKEVVVPKGIKGARGEMVRFTAPAGIGVVVSTRAGELSRDMGRRVAPEEVDRLAHLLGLAWLRGGSLLLAGVSCGPESERMLRERLGLPDDARLQPADGAHHQALVDLYHDRFLAVRGTAPKITPVDLRAFKKLREDVGYDGARAAICGAFADRFWKGKVTIQRIAKDPNQFLGASNSSVGTQQQE